jgi:hypothetical protein
MDMRSNSSNSSPLEKVASDTANCDFSDYPETKVLNTTSMEWTSLRCAPSSVQAALELAALTDLGDLKDADSPGANAISTVEPGGSR